MCVWIVLECSPNEATSKTLIQCSLGRNGRVLSSRNIPWHVVKRTRVEMPVHHPAIVSNQSIYALAQFKQATIGRRCGLHLLSLVLLEKEENVLRQPILGGYMHLCMYVPPGFSAQLKEPGLGNEQKKKKKKKKKKCPAPVNDSKQDDKKRATLLEPFPKMERRGRGRDM
ncbi:hypothetical protein K504DRAFT_39908 [Pleomassaria siparia CBS 279.74]|uniref:Uncharacterized protein n=1 Tax=Pleomassaria siparia CBS 279.74 TaxID=1314801 RepID=A0A6G1K433_9PLEO|nr:hypothetical protein K504DRAFT_39908 [Pleomassaria siparia CBS 279.74]